MKHKHAELMMQYAQDAMETSEPWKRWQYNSNKDDLGFISCDKYTMAFYDDYDYRRKPKMVSVTLANGETVSWPEPHKVILDYGIYYYTACEDGEVGMYEYKNTIYDNNCIRFGLVHLTKEAAKQHSHALFKINNQVAK